MVGPPTSASASSGGSDESAERDGPDPIEVVEPGPAVPSGTAPSVGSVGSVGEPIEPSTRRGTLLPCERAILGSVVRKGMRVLDLGVTPASTIATLSEKAMAHAGGLYRGVATGAETLRDCQAAFPDLVFEEGDGADLASFAGGQFDAVVFARCGLARLEPDDQRVACEQEIYRVLRTGGVAVLSMVNPQAVVEPPSGWRSASPARRARLFVGSAGEMLRTTGEGWRDGSAARTTSRSARCSSPSPSCGSRLVCRQRGEPRP
jgi:SAM-dependent methyltransferase